MSGRNPSLKILSCDCSYRGFFVGVRYLFYLGRYLRFLVFGFLSLLFEERVSASFGEVSGFSTFEAEVVFVSFLLFWGPFLDRVDVHCVWVFLFVVIVSVVILVEGVCLSPRNFICLFLYVLEAQGCLVPFVDGIWHRVHPINFSH